MRENNVLKRKYVEHLMVMLNKIKVKNTILVDDVYTKGTNVIEDCIQTLFDIGAKKIVLYAIAKAEN